MIFKANSDIIKEYNDGRQEYRFFNGTVYYKTAYDKIIVELTDRTYTDYLE